MSPGRRKLALSAHLTVSVGWIGAIVAYLVLAIAATTSRDEQIVRGVRIGMELTGWYAIVPLALSSLATGIIMAFGTRWGPFRHYWVLISLGLTFVATAVLLLHMPEVSAAADLARTPGADPTMLGSDLVHPGIGFAVLLVVQVLNVYKPRGMTQYGVRTQRERRAAATAD